MSRFLTRLFVLPALGGLALLLSAAPVSAQQSQIPRGNETGGEAGGGGSRGGGGGSQSGGTGEGAAGRGTSGSDGMASADDIFADGVQRNGAPEQRGIGNAPGMAGAGGAAAGGGGLGGFGGMGGFGGLGGFGGMSPFGGGQFGGQNQQTRSVRTRLSSRVEVEPLPPRVVGAAVSSRLSALSGNPRFQSVSVRMEGRTAVLTGEVASDDDRRMARLLVQLEPGVSRIENRLQIASQP